MSLRRGRRKNCNTTTDSESAISLRELLKTNKTSHEKTTIVELSKTDEVQNRKKRRNDLKENKKQKNSRVSISQDISLSKEHIEHQATSQDFPVVTIVSDSNDLNDSMINNTNKSENQRESINSESDTPDLSTSHLTERTNAQLKRKKLHELSNLPSKCVKLDANTHSILEKILEEQLKQRMTIETLQEKYAELKSDIYENHKLLQNMLAVLTKEPSLTTNNQAHQLEGKVKQRLKRKDTKHLWWDVPMTEACHQLFQENKNPSDADIERAFKSKIQTDYPKKLQEIVDSSGWDNFWNAGYSITLEYFHNYRSSYVHKIKDAVYATFNLISHKLNKFASPTEVRSWKESEQVKQARSNLWNKIDNEPNSPSLIEDILRKVFMKEELQNENNIKFSITVAWMLLDPSYDQVEISSSKVQERMDKWDTDSIIQKWLNKKNNNNEINSEYNSELDENEILQEAE
ncbi:uncharacterized protein OCT59_012823 [Rhizophagus irregularis]|uniref:uncharacterized protein n=1 Tax=Rhizophagus irregularis TaxID=588596 RepID=UPI000CB1631C|nr:hypothetical protein OCT59_012823 [Rhizophagus irregularis]GBC32054.1 hypothetical protein GLOIN_2v1819612 [Rhizophagus irregularis DAOM 181602=DAOM 197198]